MDRTDWFEVEMKTAGQSWLLFSGLSRKHLGMNGPRKEFESFHDSWPRSVDQHTGHKDQAIVFDSRQTRPPPPLLLFLLGNTFRRADREDNEFRIAGKHFLQRTADIQTNL